MRALTRLLRGFGAAAALCLAACSATPVRAPDAALFDDALFAPQSERIDSESVFAPSPQMLEYVESGIAPIQRSKGRQLGLFYALYDPDAPWLDYESAVTRTAAEAFAARSGNCLSLVLMTGAFARLLGLEVRYQSVYDLESWTRDERLSYLNTHVNVVLLAPRGLDGDAMVIDFLPPGPNQRQRSRVLEETRIIAMYMNNRAVELLAGNELDRAYWWVRAARRQDPAYLEPVNTLAVVYRARGARAESQRALEWLLEREPDNLVALDNLALVLEDLGREQESAAVAKRIAGLRRIPPFHYYDLGEAALRQGRYLEAKELFRKEMRRDANYDKFHASLALAHFGLGELSQAQAHMAIALERSTTAADRAQYARMLAHLKAGKRP
jgi:Tfp pilus assembly protein PilF